MPQETANLNSELKARVPEWLVSRIEEMARARLAKSSQLVREALIEYVEKHDKKDESSVTA